MLVSSFAMLNPRIIESANKQIIGTHVENASNEAGVIRVLHVDDDQSMLEISKQILLDLDNRLKIDFAFTAEEAFKKMATRDYDIIISDYEMPQKSGLDFLKDLREQKSSIPFVLFTGKGREEVAIKALNLGADGYFNKQGDPETVYGELVHGLQHTVARKRAETKLHEAQNITQKIVDCTPNLIYIYDIINNKNIYANKEVSQFLGYTTEQVQALGSALFANILHPDDAKAVAEHHARFVNATDNVIYELDYRMRHASGEWHWLRSHDMLFSRTREGKGQLILGTCEDITERKKSEEKLAASELKYKSIFENAEIGMFVTKLDGSEIIDCNEKFLRIFGRRRNEVQGNSSVIHWVNPAQRKKLVAILREEGGVTDFECQMLNNKGEVRLCRTSIKLYPEKSILEGSIIDVTEQKKAETALKESEERYRKSFEESMDAIFIIDPEKNVIIDCNYAALQLTGYTKTELISKPQSILYSPSNLQNEFSKGSKFDIIGSNTVCRTIVTKTGDVKDVMIKAGVFELNGKNLAQWVLRDVTLQKYAEHKVITLLKEAETSAKEWQLTFDSASEIIMLISPSFEILKINKSGYASLGKKPQELIGKRCYEVVHGTGAPIMECPCVKTLRTKKAGVGELTQFGRCFILTASPVFNEKSELRAFVHTVTDITERKKHELELIDDQKRLALMNEKLQVVGSLTRHDVGNKLMFAKSNLYFLRKKLKDSPELLRYMDAIDEAFSQSNKIFEFSRLYEKIGSEKPEKINVADSFDEASKLISHSGIEVVNKAQELIVQADSSLRQLFYNLIDNTLKHGKKATKIELSFTEKRNQTSLVYKDNGVGIPSENKSKIFNKGFTTQGTGLGLQLVKRMIEVYGWTIIENGESDKGARFEITIPKDQNSEPQ